MYFRYDDPDSVCGYCILKRKDIDMGFGQCCDDVVLRPSVLLSYFLKHEHYCDDWFLADEMARDYLGKVDFNDYPKR